MESDVIQSAAGDSDLGFHRLEWSAIAAAIQSGCDMDLVRYRRLVAELFTYPYNFAVVAAYLKGLLTLLIGHRLDYDINESGLAALELAMRADWAALVPESESDDLTWALAVASRRITGDPVTRRTPRIEHTIACAVAILRLDGTTVGAFADTFEAVARKHPPNARQVAEWRWVGRRRANGAGAIG